MSTESIKIEVDKAVERAAIAEEYSTVDGTRVKRPKLTELLDARRDLIAQQQSESGGMFRRVQMGRPG